jgi:carboxyl-terminal processing protease
MKPYAFCSVSGLSKLFASTSLGLLLFSPILANAEAVSLDAAAVPAIDATTSTTADTPTVSASQETDINRFINTISVIKKDYALPVNDKKLLENAIRGMVNNLDPHSEYLDEDAYKSLLTSTSGEFGGLGIEVTSEFGVLKVISPIDDTPAAKAGIKASDYIVALNGKPVNDMTPNEAIGQMRGAKGTQIVMTILRKGVKDPLKFTLTRATIHIDSVKSKMLDGDVGYVRLSQFQEATTQLLQTAITNLEKQANGHLKGLILDLRNNPGGLLETAVGVVNLFLDSDKLTKFDKKIVYTEGRVSEAQYKAKATGEDILHGAPLIVLINEGSASASEIVSGALQDYHRAVIVGTTSFGKGSVQTVLPLDETHAIKLTTALYLTPSGRIIQNQGIIPDIFIADIKVSSAKDLAAIDPLREMQLKDHLNNPNNNLKTDAPSQALTALAQEDFQLYESLNILRAMSLGSLKP